MKTGAFLYGVLAAAAVLVLEAPPVDALKQAPPGGPAAMIVATPVPDVNTWKVKPIGHDKVKPFVQPEPVSISDKAAVKFKPQLHISQGCHPYPAVNAKGETSIGIGEKGFAEGKCKGSPLGSQVYGRSSWYRTVWAMVYTWYIPDENSIVGRYDWEHVVVWLDNPEAANPKLRAVSLWNVQGLQYKKLVPPGPEVLDGASLKLIYGDIPGYLQLNFTSLGGEIQPLITWDQLTEDARRALNAVTWNGKLMPVSGSRYEMVLDNAWPWGPSV